MPLSFDNSIAFILHNIIIEIKPEGFNFLINSLIIKDLMILYALSKFYELSKK